MDSIVLELQRDAASHEVPATDLLRKAMLVARKLGVAEFAEWTRRELNGYGPDDELPQYRIIIGQPRAQTIGGLKPIMFEDEDLNRTLSRGYVRQSVGEIVGLVEDSEPGYLTMEFPAQLSQLLSRMNGFDVHAMQFFSKASFAGIIDAVRSTVLDWSLKLEEQGILGEGLTFSAEEKQKASQAAGSINYINIGSMVNSQIQQAAEHSEQKQTVTIEAKAALRDFVSELKAHLERHADELDLDEQQEAQAELTTLETQLASPKPKKRIIAESLHSLRRIMEGAGGKLLASGIMDQFPVMIAMLSAA